MLFYLAKHMVNNEMGWDAFQIHKKVPFGQQDGALESLTRPFAPRRDLNFVPAHQSNIPDALKPRTMEDFDQLSQMIISNRFVNLTSA